MENAARSQIITELYDCYKAKGFISEDEALSLFAAKNVPLHQIDSITEHLLSMGVIITADTDEEDELFSDRSKVDYDAIYDDIIKQCPGLEPTIEYVRSIARPLRNEWQKLMPQAQNGNQYARNRLIEMYLRSAVRLAYDLSKRFHLSIEDTLQDGFWGAISSVDNYNPAEHMSYSTTIQWRISQAICRNRWLPNNPCYFPVHIKDKLFSIIEEVEKHECECCRIIDDVCPQLTKEISKKYEWSHEEAETNIRYCRDWDSLDIVIENEDIFNDNNLFCECMDENISASQNNTYLHKTLKTLTERQQQVLTLRFGLDDGKERTLEEVGNIFGVTRERIRQIEAKALRRLQKKLSSKYPELSQKNKPQEE